MILRLLLILLFITPMLFAKQNDTCYSVQLSSFNVKENTTYKIEDHGDPPSCKAISFSTTNAIRCGCFSQYGYAKRQQKIFKSRYPNSLIVKTKKYRFTSNKSLVHSKKKQLFIPAKVSLDESTEEKIIQGQEQEEEGNFLKEIVIQGNVNMTMQSYITKPEAKHRDNYTATAELELAYNKDNLNAFVKFKALLDYYDIQGGEEETLRSYFRVNEAYVKYDFEDSQIMFGKNIRFWGALEVHNLTDGFNINELRSDSAEKDKIGSWNSAYTYYTNSGEVAIIAKFHEQNREIAAYPSVYHPFTNTAFVYDENLQTQDSKNRPSIYLKYSGSTNSEYTLDYSVIFENGYDSQRYYAQNTLSPNIIQEHAYLVNKLLTYNTLVLGSTLYKLEATYANVINDVLIADYYNIGLGVEHTLTQIYSEADLGLLAEYYNYSTINPNNNQYDDLALFEVFQNDLFVGARYSFNQGDSASIVGGAIIDLDYDEQVYYIEYEGRIYNLLKLNIDYRQTEPSSTTQTALRRMGRQQRISLKLGYYF